MEKLEPRRLARATFWRLAMLSLDFLHENVELVPFGIPLSLQPVIWGAASGALTGLLTIHRTIILSVLLAKEQPESSESQDESLHCSSELCFRFIIQ